MKKLNVKESKLPALLFMAGALVLLLLAWIFHGKPVLQGIFGGLSALVSLYGLLPELLKAWKTKDFHSGLLLLVLAAVLYACTGRLVGAALALLLWSAGQQLLKQVKARKRTVLQNRRALSPLMQELPELETEPVLADDRDLLLRKEFPLLMVLLAALAVILTVLVTKNGAGEAIRRAAVILSLGGTAGFFLAFPFGDLAAALAAGEQGVLFRGKALSRLQGVNLACADLPEPEDFGDAAVIPALPEKMDAKMIVRLAALALSKDETPWSERVMALYGAPATAHIRTKLLESYGVVAQAADMTILCGTAEFMKKADLPVFPFEESDDILHVAINGVYAGCIDFSEDAGESDAEALLSGSGFYCFADAAEAAEKRDPGESVLFLGGNGKTAEADRQDLFVSAGIVSSDADIVLDRFGTAGLRDLTEHLRQVQLCRKSLVLLSLAVKGVLFLLALFGLCPLWLAAALEALEACFAVLYAMRAMETGSRF